VVVYILGTGRCGCDQRLASENRSIYLTREILKVSKVSGGGDIWQMGLLPSYQATLSLYLFPTNCEKIRVKGFRG